MPSLAIIVTINTKGDNMAEKRIIINEETLEELKQLHKGLNDSPRSRTELSNAISEVVHTLIECNTLKVEFDEVTENLIQEMIRFSMIASRKEFVESAIKKAVEDKKEELKNLILKHQENLGL